LIRIFIDKVLELPGGPISKIGILLAMQTRVIIIFYFTAAFKAIYYY